MLKKQNICFLICSVGLFLNSSILGIIITTRQAPVMTSNISLKNTNGWSYQKKEHEDNIPSLYVFDYSDCPSDIKKAESLSFPKHYPQHGTGKTVKYDEMFPPIYVTKICETELPLKAVLTVYSSAQKFERRLIIRETIGKDCIRLNCRVVFICSISEEEAVTKDLSNEYELYGDIVIIHKIDSYTDLNDKAVGMLDWLLNWCRQPKYVIHFVDDTFINIEMFYRDLHKLKNKSSIYGVVDSIQKPIRHSENKYYVDPQLYPYPMFPDFVGGPAYAFPNAVTHRLRCAVPNAIYNWLEDVWLTGHVREVAGLEAINTRRPYHRFRRVSEGLIKTAFKYIYIHNVDSRMFHEIYTVFEKHRNSTLKH